MSSTDQTAEVATSGVAADELQQFVERAERVQEDIDSAKADLKEIMLELKGRGFDAKAFRTILKLRKQDREKRQEEEAILELYMQALNMA